MRSRAFILTAGTLTAALVGVAALVVSAPANAAPISTRQVSLAASRVTEPVHHRCWWRHGARHCHRHSTVILGPRVYVGPNVVVRIR